MPKPACVKCRCFYRPKRNGIHALEGMPIPVRGEERIRDNGEIRGRRLPTAWQAYKVWQADLWECPDCGHELIAGYGRGPVLERHDEDFNRKVLEYGDEMRAMGFPGLLPINDC